MSHLDYRRFYRRNLPHIQPPGGTFFVTFNLAGTFPARVIQDRAVAERSVLDKQREPRELEQPRTRSRRSVITLDKAQCGPMWLKDERIATVVAESLHYRDGKVYRLDAYCIMPNHVHVVFLPLLKQSFVPTRVGTSENATEPGELYFNSLSSIMQSLKGYTARRANRLLGRRGQFWQRESFDRWIRVASEWERTIAYVLNNPVKAGLVDNWEAWTWSYFRYSDSGNLAT